MHFVLCKNRILSRQMRAKSIPTLELQAVTLGVETVIDTYRELTRTSCVTPIKIDKLFLFTDSLVCIHWLQSSSVKFDKMNRHTIFVQNRLKCIATLCDEVTVTFKFCAGSSNPADKITRAVSYNQLIKSNYFAGVSVPIVLILIYRV